MDRARVFETLENNIIEYQESDLKRPGLSGPKHFVDAMKNLVT
jgi:hypothetical protein